MRFSPRLRGDDRAFCTLFLNQERDRMTDKDITQVRIGQHGFGIIGIQRLMEELAEKLRR